MRMRRGSAGWRACECGTWTKSEYHVSEVPVGVHDAERVGTESAAKAAA
jgi:hypothetical protein